jgi:hypothetical protein
MIITEGWIGKLSWLGHRVAGLRPSRRAFLDAGRWRSVQSIDDAGVSQHDRPDAKIEGDRKRSDHE